MLKRLALLAYTSSSLQFLPQIHHSQYKQPILWKSDGSILNLKSKGQSRQCSKAYHYWTCIYITFNHIPAMPLLHILNLKPMYVAVVCPLYKGFLHQLPKPKWILFGVSSKIIFLQDFCPGGKTSLGFLHSYRMWKVKNVRLSCKRGKSELRKSNWLPWVNW